MTWQPVSRATDVRAMLGNLLSFFASNQVDALAWASPSVELEPLAIYPTAETQIKTDFPHLGCVKRRIATKVVNIGLEIEYSLTFEIEIAATHTEENRSDVLAQLLIDTDNYTYAFESMFLNIPDDVLLSSIPRTRLNYWAITSSDPIQAAVSNTRSMFNVQMNAVLNLTEIPANS